MKNAIRLQQNVFSKNHTMTSRDRNNIRRTLLWVKENNPSSGDIDHILNALDLEDSIYFLRRFSN